MTGVRKMPGVSLESWSDRVANLVDLCAEEPGEVEHVRETDLMLQAGPPALCAPLAQAIARHELDQLLDAEAAESAAMKFLKNCGFMLSGAPGALYLATVALPGARRDFSFSGRSGATAICGAIATALLDAVTARPVDWQAFPSRDH